MVVVIKYKIAFLLLTVVYNVYPMDVMVELPATLDRKCYLIAKYKHQFSVTKPAAYFLSEEKQLGFYDKAIQQAECYAEESVYSDIQKKAEEFTKTWLTKTINQAYEDYCNLSNGVRYEIALRYKDSPFAMFINEGHGIVCKDIIGECIVQKAVVSDMDQSAIYVKSYNEYEQEILAAHARANGVWFFNSTPADDSTKREMQSVPVENIKNILLRNHYGNMTIEQLIGMTVSRPIFVFEVHDEAGWQSYDRRGWNFVFTEDQNKEKTTILMGLDFFLKTWPLRFLLQSICEGSTKGYGDVAQRCKLNTNEVARLKKLIDSRLPKDCKEWSALKEAQIGIDLPHITMVRKLNDLLLLAIPLGIADGVIPSLVYQRVNGKITGVIGAAGCTVAGYFVGNNLFPFLDAWHSDIAVLSDSFGKNNIRTIRVGFQFAVFTALNFVMHALAEYSGNFSMHLRMAIQASRFLLFAFSLLSQRSSTFRSEDNFFGKFRFVNPLLRRNKDDRSYTLGDLLDAKS